MKKLKFEAQTFAHFAKSPDEEVHEDVMVEMVTTLFLLKIFQHVCHYSRYLL